MLIKTVSALLYTDNSDILLHRHPKFGMFLGPGGHVDGNEHQYMALTREVFEETGLELSLMEYHIDDTRTKIISPTWTVESKLDSGDVMINDTYSIRVDEKIRHQELITEADNEMGWYDIQFALDNFPMFADTRLKIEKIRDHLQREVIYFAR